jgi:hypothetical protein
MMAAARSCTFPDDIALTAEDGDDAGVAPDCKNVPRKIIAENCIGGYCHDNVGPPAAGLDLMSPCVADRLVSIRSSCMDFLLIDPSSVERSFIHDKVSAQYPKCGKSMPDGGHLPPEQVRCLNAWITAVVHAANRK